MEEVRDHQIRLAAFTFLERQTRIHGDVLPRELLEQGFVFEGLQVRLLGPQGIFKPAVLRAIPISITTVPVVEGRPRPYDDVFRDDGLDYRYRGNDPHHGDNVGLRLAMERQVPLVYFHGVVPGQYLAVWPVYIVGDDPQHHSFTVQVDDPGVLKGAGVDEVREDVRRGYSLRLLRQRLHQAGFRQRVIHAYRRMCAVCRLRHSELLDAAHILPDRLPSGTPAVSNGLSLCKLHHAAFDADILGIRPDRIIDVRRDVLEEIDGPMLQHGLQGIHGKPLLLPGRRQDHPNAEHLEERYEQYRRAG